ncbi:MAG TPA: hypothetical protein VFW07_12170 [Parafilimonas sp.]|nr:hypothetical protein [Parafilimonas sp.]
MKLFIEKESLAEDVKKIFTTCYPFLKIEFYKKQPAHTEVIQKKEIMPFNLPLIQFINGSNRTVIDIGRHITVEQLEDQFASLGLLSEVFRKSGNVWIETSLTSGWTLQQQNTEGEEISRHFVKKSPA